jgi:dTDP-4-amino-4,6-dideoxygalactose transaminase
VVDNPGYFCALCSFDFSVKQFKLYSNGGYMSYRVRFVKPDEHYRRLKPEIDDALFSCISKGDLVNRRQLKEFEEHLADFVGTRYAVGVNSGYHALAFSLLAN